MNIAFFITPKSSITYIYDDYSIRQGIEKMSHHGYSAIPVITRSGKYVGTVSEGDFLWYIVDNRCLGRQSIDLKSLEHIPITGVVNTDRTPSVNITATMEELLDRAMNHNFVPVVDDSGSFIGIVTRKAIISHFCSAPAALGAVTSAEIARLQPLAQSLL